MPEIKWNAVEVIKETKEKAADYMQEILFMMEAHAKREMAASGSPSQPGAYPGVDTSRLMPSLTTELDRDALEGRFGTNLKEPPYPLYLEFGTSKMAARPWAVPTLEAIRKQLK